MKKLLFVFILNLILNNIISSQTIRNGYTDKLSYRAGEEVTFFISAPQNQTIDIPLIGVDGNQAFLIPQIDMQAQTMNSNLPYQNGFGYSASTHKWTVLPQSRLKTGRYFIQASDDNILTLIKGDNTYADIIIVIPTNTYNAYTTSGGKNFYISNVIGVANTADILSFKILQEAFIL